MEQRYQRPVFAALRGKSILILAKLHRITVPSPLVVERVVDDRDGIGGGWPATFTISQMRHHGRGHNSRHLSIPPVGGTFLAGELLR